MPFPYAGAKVDATNELSVAMQVPPIEDAPPAKYTKLVEHRDSRIVRSYCHQSRRYCSVTRDPSNLSAPPPFGIYFVGENMEFCVMHMHFVCGYMQGMPYLLVAIAV